ncbi:MAG TPA: RHS repeat-associated core domain-containing protein [Tahibacter sp.]|nr:RHS repeat-associated core domain-containing protein [Tahibacter sp.]
MNGDGLTDLLFATVPGQGCSDGSDGTVEMSVPQLPGTSGRGTWCIKLSTGRGFGNAITVGGNTDALLLQENRGSPSTGEQAMFRYAGRLPVADFDADGKANLLYPVALAARHCQYTTVTHITSSDTSTLCPYEPVNGRATNDGSAVCTNNVWMCANDPREAIEGVNTYALPALNTFPVYQPVQQQAVAVDNLYTPIVDKASYVEIDKSAYVMSGIRFEQTGPASFVATPVALDQAGTAAHRVVMRLAGDSRVDVADDLYGDGLVDTVFQIGCYTQGFRPDACQYVGGASGPSTVTISPAQGAAATTVQVTDLENGLRTWVNENVGIAETTGGPPLLPDLVGSIQNGMNDNVVWAYYPLSSKAFRSGSNVMPLYELPANDDEYADSRHFYFKSSMPVVGSMGRSAGGGLSAFGSRSWTYSYREAMYNSRGRGFQGFRTIMQEHLTLGSIENRRLRTTTTYHQKFPLTGKVERVETGVPNGNSGINPVKVETYLWGCAVATSAPCDVDSGARPANFPFLVEQTATTYDLASSEAGAQVPVATTTVRNRGLVPAKPGWDVYGNLLFQDVVSSDEYVFNATQRTQNTFATPDLGVWWVDKLSKTVKTTLSVAYQSQHSLPVGAMAPQQTLTTKYEWNADRTPSVVEIQPSEKFGVEPRDDQYAKTTYTYPGAPYNYGLPRLVATLIHRADERPLPDEPDPEKAVYQTRYVETRFDGTDGYFASEVRYPGDENGTYFLRPGIKTTSRARDGQPSLVEDLATGMRIVTTYDAFGRAIVVDTLNALGVRVKQPVRTAWQRCVGGVCPGVGAGGLNRAGQSADRLAEYRVVTAQNGAPTQVVMYDLLNREIKRAARSLDANLSFVASTTDYDVMGMATNQSAPFKLTGAQATTSYETVSTYDRLGRVKTRTTPGNELDPANGNVVSDYTYAGNRTTVRVRTANDPGCSLSSTSTLCMVMTRDASVLGLVRTTDTLGGVTTYWYDSAKRPIAIRDAKANRPDEPDYATLAQYNELGHRVVLDDPNMGHWTFKYNPFGELRKQTDARGFDTIVDLRDPLGRVVTQTSTDPKRYDSGRETVVDQWAYDPNTGLLNDVSRSYDGVERWRETYTYDALARPTTTVTSIRLPDQTYLKDLVTKFQYDTNYGREKATEYPSGLRVQTIYAKTGDVQDVLDADTGIRLWAVESKDAWGNVAVQRYGNGLVGQYTAAASTGQSLRREWLVPGQAAKDAIDYAYDSFGNLKRQTRTTPTELNPTATESYLYDRLQRLVQATPSTGTAVAYGYDAVGNFAYKSDFSTTSATAYQYQGNGTNKCGPNVATSVARPGNLTALYTCDANGNIATSDNSGNYTSQRRMVYDATNRPLVIVASGVTEFYYTPNGDRFASVSKLGAPSTAGSLVLRGPRGYEEESEYADRSQVTQRHELGEAVVTWGPGTRRWTSYRASDRLGSALGLMNDDVAKLFDQLQWGLSSKALLSFDAFGMPKDRDFKWRANASTNLGATRQGFTGHEHIVAPGGAANPEVIHMNGRAYDFRLGRFLSVDPLIQSPANSQSLNPYSYVLNNPLAGIDPSGYASCKMTDDVSCLEDGVNTVTDADGNKTSVIVGEAGDNIALSGNGFDVKDLKFVSGSINLAYNPSNGAEDWVKNGPAGTRDPSVIGGPKDASKGCAGGGPLQCYSVRSEGNEVTSFERTFKASGSTAALNGMLNNVGRAMELMAKHVRGRLGEEDFLLVHNPTEGMLRDLWESSRDKMGWTTDIAKQFAGVLASARQPMQWVAHSQGGAIFSEAIRYGFNNGVTDMSNVRVAFHAGANNRWMTGRYATRAGVGVLGYYDAPNDLVPQIVGLRAWNRPDRLLWSIYSAPSLFGEKSPHTYPYRPDY